MPLKFKSFYSSLHKVEIYLRLMLNTKNPQRCFTMVGWPWWTGFLFTLEISRLFDMDILLLDIVMLILIYIYSSYMLICTTLYQPLCMYPYIYFCDGQKSAPIATFRIFFHTTSVSARSASSWENWRQCDQHVNGSYGEPMLAISSNFSICLFI